MSSLLSAITGEVICEEVDASAIPSKAEVEFMLRKVQRDIDWVDKLLGEVLVITHKMRVWAYHGGMDLEHFVSACDCHEVRRAFMDYVFRPQQEYDFKDGAGI